MIYISPIELLSFGRFNKNKELMKFKVEDKVKCIEANDTIAVGSIGIIKEDSDVPWVKWENSGYNKYITHINKKERYCCISDYKLELVEPNKTQEFKVGDIVTPIGDECRETDINEGGHYELTEVIGTTIDFSDSDGCRRTRNSENYKLVETFPKEGQPLEEYIIHCPTERDWNRIHSVLFRKGLFWSSDSKKEGKINHVWTEGNNCMNIGNDRIEGHCNKEWYEKEQSNTPIISASEFLENNLVKEKIITEDCQYDWPSNYIVPPRFMGHNTFEMMYGNFKPLFVKPKLSIMQKLTNAIKRRLNPKYHALFKAGYINGQLELTPQGVKELNEIQLETNIDALTKSAKEFIEEQEENN